MCSSRVLPLTALHSSSFGQRLKLDPKNLILWMRKCIISLLMPLLFSMYIFNPQINKQIVDTDSTCAKNKIHRSWPSGQGDFRF